MLRASCLPSLLALYPKLDSSLLLETVENDLMPLVETFDLRRSYLSLGDLGTRLASLEDGEGKTFCDAVCRLILGSMLSLDYFKPSCVVPPLMKEEMKGQTIRIEREICNPHRPIYSGTSDAFLKDFALLRGKALPCITGIVDTNSSIRRRPLISANLPSKIQFLSILLRKPLGTRFFLQHHVHTSMLPNFNPEGRRRCYELANQFLAANKNYKGFCATSWFYDPELSEISPRLRYLADYPISGGAKRFYVGPDHSGSALSKSETRRRLNATGRYQPKSYLLVWLTVDMVNFHREKGSA